MSADPGIARGAVLQARAFQLVYPVMNRLLLSSPKVEFATTPVPPPTTVRVPTRYGSIDALVYSPPPERLAELSERGERPPVHVLIHGGAFILQYTRGEGNIARYLASELGCVVVMPFYRAAPQVRHPVGEYECFDTYRWVREHGDDHGWDTDRVTVGGPSTGGHFTLAVALLALEENYPLPSALSVEFAPTDLALGPGERTSEKKHPVISHGLVDLVLATYFVGVDTADTLASPVRNPRLGELPPTLVLTAEYDALRPESERLATLAAQQGAPVTYRMVTGVDHGFLALPPAAKAREGAEAIRAHLAAAYRTEQTAEE